ncbi:Fluconazole resistance protein 1 [Sporothrix eucalyptigena]|uniref:Fluconazole resistance protein 1 n=1 Tax=Sporothrix eucalyptigena TaxID=1812306 RepID=A0ABP0B476_9PEZI
MVRSAQAWDLGEPELNERGQPVIHSIASKLGCIRPNNDPDLPMGSSVFPENEQDLSELASQLEDHQKKREAEQAITAAAAAQAETQAKAPKTTTSVTASSIPITMSTSLPTTMMANTTVPIDFSLGGRFDRASSSEDIDTFSDMDDYRKNVFGNGNGNSSVNSASTTMSPQSLNYNDFDGASNQSAPSPTLPTTQYTNWMTQTVPVDMASSVLQQPQRQTQFMQLQFQQQQRQLQQQHLQQQQIQQLKQPALSLSIPVSMATGQLGMLGSSEYSTDMLLRQGLAESDFGSLVGHMVPPDVPGVMLGAGDPMIFGGDYDDNML